MRWITHLPQLKDPHSYSEYLSTDKGDRRADKIVVRDQRYEKSDLKNGTDHRA